MMRTGTILLAVAAVATFAASGPASAGLDDTHPYFYGSAYVRPYGIAAHGYRPVMVDYYGGRPAIYYWGRQPVWYHGARSRVAPRKVKYRHRRCHCGAYASPPYRQGPVWPRGYYNVRIYYGWR